MTQSDPIHCPIQHLYDIDPCPPGELSPLIEFLETNSPVDHTMTFPRGAFAADGRLDLCKQDLGPEGCERVTKALHGHTQVRSIMLGTDGIGDIGSQAVADLIRVNPNVEVVYLGCNRISDAGAAALCDALEDCEHVTGLWLKRNPIRNDGVRRIADMLRVNRSIRTLDLVNTGFGIEALQYLLDALAQNETVERLYLGGNGLEREAAISLGRFLSGGHSLKELLLNVNRIGDQGTIHLAEALSVDQRLERIALASNGIGAGGIQALCEALVNHPMVTDVDLGYSPSTRVLGSKPNHVDDTGAEHIAAMLRTNQVIRRLKLNGTDMDEHSRAIIYESLAHNKTLCQLTLDGPLPQGLKEVLDRNAGATSTPAVPEDLRLIQSTYRRASQAMNTVSK